LPFLSQFLRFGPRIDRYNGLTVYRHRSRVDVDLQSADVTHQVLRQLKPKRHPTLVAKLRSAFGAVVLIVADGDDWDRTHKAIAPFFTPAYTRQHYLPTIHAIATETFAELKQRIIASANGALVVQVEGSMRHVTSRVMGFVLFGVALTPQEADHVRRVMDVAMQSSDGWPTNIANRLLGVAFHLLDRQHKQPVLFRARRRKALDALLAFIVAKLESGGASNGVASPVRAALEQRFAEHDPPARTKLIAAEYAMMFIAGVETTAAALTFALIEIVNDPPVLQRVVAEARQTATDAPPSPSEFPYIHQVFQEALRKSTVVPTILRQAAHAATVAQAPIPARATFRALVSRFHRNPGVWPRAGQFDPDRFAAPLSAEQRAHYMPFGSGPNVCLGRDIASVEAVLTIAAFFRHLRIAPGTLKPLTRKDTRRTAIDTIRPKRVTATVSVCDALPD
jgi:cytochrome P450